MRLRFIAVGLVAVAVAACSSDRMSRAELQRLLDEQPPYDPGSEPLAGPDEPIARKCAEDAVLLEGDVVLRTRVTRTDRWGVIWRADIANGEAPDIVFRHVCYGRDGIEGVLITPLEMFDPAANTPPLPVQ